jgi:hypothetical protein
MLPERRHSDATVAYSSDLLDVKIQLKLFLIKELALQAQEASALWQQGKSPAT